MSLLTVDHKCSINVQALGALAKVTLVCSLKSACAKSLASVHCDQVKTLVGTKIKLTGDEAPVEPQLVLDHLISM